MRYARCGPWAAALALGLLGAPALAQGPAEPAPQIRTGLSPADVMAVAEQAEAAGDTATAITAYRALAVDPDVDVRSEARFRHGRLLAAAKDYRGAALLYRAILDERPDAGRVRLELANMLYLIGDLGGSRRELRQARAGGLPTEVAAVVDQFAGALRSLRPYGASISVALAPDSNINRATNAETLDTIIAPLELSEDAQARSGVGLKLGAQAFARLPIGDRLTLLPRLSGQGDIYRDERFNDVSTSAGLGLEFVAGANRIRPALGATWRIYGGDLYARTQSLSVNWILPAGPRAQFSADASLNRARYLQNPLQDGWIYDLNASYERALDARTGGTLTLSATRQTARDPGYSTTSAGATLLAYRELGRVTAFGSLGLRRLEGDARLFLFTDRRKEWLFSASAGATFRQAAVAGFAPLVRASYERNASSVGIYDYGRTSVEFGIARAF